MSGVMRWDAVIACESHADTTVDSRQLSARFSPLLASVMDAPEVRAMIKQWSFLVKKHAVRLLRRQFPEQAAILAKPKSERTRDEQARIMRFSLPRYLVHQPRVAYDPHDPCRIVEDFPYPPVTPY